MQPGRVAPFFATWHPESAFVSTQEAPIDRHDMTRTAAFVGGAHRQLRILLRLEADPDKRDILRETMADLETALSLLDTPSSKAAYMREYRARKQREKDAATALALASPSPALASGVGNCNPTVTYRLGRDSDDPIDVLSRALDKP